MHWIEVQKLGHRGLDRMKLHGNCHCGNVTWRLTSGLSADDVVLRVCRCEFCLRHRPRYWSDPRGGVELQILEPARTIAYRFGQGTADFVICAVCGVFCLAIAHTAQGIRAVVNMNLALGRDVGLPATLLEALEENETQRNERRSLRWTPLTSGWP